MMIGVVGVVAIMLTGIASASASASSWHVKSATGQIEELKTGESWQIKSHSASFEVSSPERNVRVACDAGVTGKISGKTGLSYTETLSNCKAYSLKNGKQIPCVVEVTKPLTYSGTGEKVSGGVEQVISLKMTGGGCVLPENALVYAPDVSLTIDGGAASSHSIDGTAAGYWATGAWPWTETPATVTTHQSAGIWELMYPSVGGYDFSGRAWGWY